MILTKALIESTEYPSLPPIWSSDEIPYGVPVEVATMTAIGVRNRGVCVRGSRNWMTTGTAILGPNLVWREIGGDCE